MADSKITDLSTTTAVAAADYFVMVDRDDTTMGASGTDKKLTPSQLATGLTPFLATPFDIGLPTRSGGSQGYGLPGCAIAADQSGNINTSAGRLYYSPIVVTEAITVDLVISRADVNRNHRVGIYAADSAWQPVGAPLFDVVLVETTGHGIKTQAVSQVLTPGLYLIASLFDTGGFGMTTPIYYPCVWASTMTTNFLIQQAYKTFAYAALPSSSHAWDTAAEAGTGWHHFAFLRWT